MRVRVGLNRFRKVQITQYPAATPKANAAMIVSRSMVESKKVVISFSYPALQMKLERRLAGRNPYSRAKP